MPAYSYPTFPFVPPVELTAGQTRLHDVLIVGAGPVGLTLALDLAARGVKSVVLQTGSSFSEGSRALCWSQRTLEILHRLGVAEKMAAKGFTWNRGRVFHGDREVFHFDLQPDPDQQFPAFINLQQYYGEQFLAEAAGENRDMIDLRWQSHVTAVINDDSDGTAVATVETPEGRYQIRGRYLVACDGARSSVRHSMNLPFSGRVFEDHFLIADVDVAEELPWTERRFWFEPDFHQGETALCHKQGDGMWRVDFQLGWEGVNTDDERKPEKALPRIRAMLGNVPIDVTWLSIYTFQCRRLQKFRHGAVFFAGDAAHQVSPFGARGGNSGVQDAENLSWKLAAVLAGKAPDRLLDSYDAERAFAADENIRITSRTTDFMTAKTPLRDLMRRAVLSLAENEPFARRLINSGRLSTPTIHTKSPLNGPDIGFTAGPVPGSPLPNVKLEGTYLQTALSGGLGFTLILLNVEREDLLELEYPAGVPLKILQFSEDDPAWPRLTAALASGSGHGVYLVRPDHHIAARWWTADLDLIVSAAEIVATIEYVLAIHTTEGAANPD